jgi:hypothetical protein
MIAAGARIVMCGADTGTLRDAVAAAGDDVRNRYAKIKG